MTALDWLALAWIGCIVGMAYLVWSAKPGWEDRDGFHHGERDGEDD